MSKNSMLPDYNNAPVIEVVCGVTFVPVERLLMPHFGLYWESIRSKYQESEEKPPLLSLVEESVGQRTLDVEAFFPRIWFVNRESKEIIQLQKDRFLHNWRKQGDSKYPKYGQIIKQFEEQLKGFQQFLSAHNLGEVKPVQYELTYVNHIPQGHGWDSLNSLNSLFIGFSERMSGGAFLPEVEGLDWTVTFPLPEKSGRLYSQVKTAIKNDDARTKILQLNLTARGMIEGEATSSLRRWFDIAHETIVRGFADLTTSDVQRDVWGRH